VVAVPDPIVELVIRLRGTKKQLADPSRNLKRLEALQKRPASTKPPRLVTRGTHVRPDTISGWPVYTVSPSSGGDPAAPGPVVLYLHGGAYVAEIELAHWMFVRQLVTEVNATVVVPLYTLAPAATASETVPTATQLAADLIERYGSGRTVIMGDSAGGGMALAVAMQLRETRHVQPAQIVLISPWLDVAVSDPEQRTIEPTDPMLAIAGLRQDGRMYAGTLDVTDPMVSPINGTLEELAPITVFAGYRDLLCVDSRALAAKAVGEAAQVTLHTQPGGLHCYPLIPNQHGAAARRAVFHLLLTGGIR
jgi:monoterpene epsilon-lactone hydrolase